VLENTYIIATERHYDMSAYRAVLALSLFYTFELSNVAFAQQQSASASPTAVLANSLEITAQTAGTQPSTNFAAKPEADARPVIVPPGTVEDTKPTANRIATGGPRHLGPERAEQEPSPDPVVAD
jgi:hypothetical protein